MSSLYTAVISDLHLTDPEPPIHKKKSKHPLWKKFKTREFYIDEAIAEFLEHIVEKANGNPVELVLNGDIFDFDSVVSLPEKATFNISWIETRRGLFPREDKSLFKINLILREHRKFVEALSLFIKKGNFVVLIPGNHDVELHFRKVQKSITDALDLNQEELLRFRFVDWFYISNQDTLIEHGNQQDPYCVCDDPMNPFLLDYNELTVRLPFGNVACRYIMNGLGLFNPHIEKNYIMDISGYLNFFFKYLVKAQPMIIWTWLWGSLSTLIHVTIDRFSEVYKRPLSEEHQVAEAARRANTTPMVVRELKELFAVPATQDPILIAKELWLDRLFLMTIGFLATFFIVRLLNITLSVSFYWIFLPLFLLVPFFLFYARSVRSFVSDYKEPDEQLLARQSEVTGVRRIVYGHTHIARHEHYGNVEHLNSGTWSPAFTDVECTQSSEKNNFVWISPSEEHPNQRKAELLTFIGKT